MIPKRFWDKVNIQSKDKCWIWTGGRGGVKEGSDGHGLFTYNGKRISAHRFLMQEMSGRDLTASEFVCHTCDTYGCCNPLHLYIGDAKTNQLDSLERTGRNGVIYRTHRNCNVVGDKIEEALEEFNRGASADYVAFKYGIDKSVLDN